MNEPWGDDPLLDAPSSAGARSRFWIGFFCGAMSMVALAGIGLVGIGVWAIFDEEADQIGYEVLRGEDVPERVWTFLHDNALVEEGEKILYFYSSTFVFQEDGNVLTDRGVVTYWDSEFESRRSDYAEVQKVQVTWSTDPEEYLTEVWITLVDGEELELWLEAEEELDRAFVAELEKRCREVEGSSFEGLEEIAGEPEQGGGTSGDGR